MFKSLNVEFYGSLSIFLAINIYFIFIISEMVKIAKYYVMTMIVHCPGKANIIFKLILNSFPPNFAFLKNGKILFYHPNGN